MGYLGVFLKAFQLGAEAATDVKCKCDLTTKAGQSKFMDKAYELVESYSQLGRYSYLGPELMKMKNVDSAVNKYDNAISDGIRSTMYKRMTGAEKKKLLRKY
jgi:hypothetical protein